MAGEGEIEMEKVGGKRRERGCGSGGERKIGQSKREVSEIEGKSH